MGATGTEIGAIVMTVAGVLVLAVTELFPMFGLNWNLGGYLRREDMQDNAGRGEIKGCCKRKIEGHDNDVWRRIFVFSFAWVLMAGAHLLAFIGSEQDDIGDSSQTTSWLLPTLALVCVIAARTALDLRFKEETKAMPESAVRSVPTGKARAIMESSYYRWMTLYFAGYALLAFGTTSSQRKVNALPLFYVGPVIGLVYITRYRLHLLENSRLTASESSNVVLVASVDRVYNYVGMGLWFAGWVGIATTLGTLSDA